MLAEPQSTVAESRALGRLRVRLNNNSNRDSFWRSARAEDGLDLSP